jgi:hypothetical protein
MTFKRFACERGPHHLLIVSNNAIDQSDSEPVRVSPGNLLVKMVRRTKELPNASPSFANQLPSAVGH